MITKKQRQEISRKVNKIMIKKVTKRWNKKKIKNITDEPILIEK